jgi:hypothetical protein
MSQAFFELANLHADRRLTDIQSLASAGNASNLGNGPEVQQVRVVQFA